MAEVSAKAVRQELGIDVAIEPGDLGQFDVLVDDEIVATKTSRSKKILFLRMDLPSFPETCDIVEAVRARIGG
jgi:hypothetical protein